MKKSKLSKGLVTCFVASLALAGCSSVAAKENSILTFNGYDGTQYDLVTESLYAEYRKDNSVISTFYDKVLEVLIRDAFLNPNSSLKSGTTYEAIEAQAKLDVDAAKTKASENANANNTSYDTEWESILSGEGVEDEDELLQKYIYNAERTALEDALYASLTTGAAGDTLKRDWIEGAHPYHVRHILAKVESGTSDYTRGTITSDQAKRLSDIGLALGLTNDTFGGIAQRLSEDEGSGKLYGDVGLVTNKATSTGGFSMVPEFQLAIYIYDAIYRGRDLTSGTGADLIPERASTAFTNKVVKVPYQVFQLLAPEAQGGFGDVTTNKDKRVVGEGEEAVYPRNLLWNRYLNHHEPFVITNESVADLYDGAAYTLDSAGLGTMLAAVKSDKDEYAKLDNNGVGDQLPAAQTKDYVEGKGTGFVDGDIIGLAGTKILADETGNPIFGVRSEYGIHFIIIQKSAFEDTASLESWYQVYSPNQAEYPKEGEVKLTSYVNYAGFDEATWNSRASAVKDAVKGFDGTYQYRLFEKLYADAIGRFNFEDDEQGKALVESITKYVTLQKEKSSYDQSEGYELAWENFLDKYDEQQLEREKFQRVIPWGCAIGFSKTVDYNTVKDLYEVGGACYYGNKVK